MSSLGFFKTFDTRLATRASAGLTRPAVEFRCQEGEALTFDYNKYQEGVRFFFSFFSSRKVRSRILTLHDLALMSSSGQIIAASGTDRLINAYDLRSISASPLSSHNPKAVSSPLLQLQGHSFAVRKVAWSPHRADLLVRVLSDCSPLHLWSYVRCHLCSTNIQASAGYDMSCQVWSTNPARALASQAEHTEFVYGLAWSLYE